MSDSFHEKVSFSYIERVFDEQVHDDTLHPFVEARLRAGRAPKTINRSISP